MGRHRASQPPGGLQQRARRILPVVMLGVATVVLWGAAFSTAARCEHSANRVMFGPCGSVNDGR